MAENKDIELDDYEGYKDIDDDIEEAETEEEINYDEFNTPNDFDVEEDYKDGEELSFEKEIDDLEKNGKYDGLITFFKWFGVVGIIIALILIAYFITKGNISGLFFYILLLVISYYLGYYVTYALDKSHK